MKRFLLLVFGLCPALLARAQKPALEPSLLSRETGKPARVIIVQNPAATEAFNPRPEIIQSMVDQAVTNLTGKASVAAAWGSLVATNDTVGLKVFSSPGSINGTRPAVVSAVVQGLLTAKIPARQIIVWDKYAVDLRLAGFYELAERFGVRVASSAAAGYDEEKFYDTALLAQLVYGDHEFGKKGEIVGRKSFVSKLVTKEMTKIISLSPLVNHYSAGVTGNLYSLAIGSVDNTLRFETDRVRMLEAVPDIYNLPGLGERVVLNIVDALICQFEGSHRGLLHYSTSLNELRFSTDPVALDVLSLQELERQRTSKSLVNTNSMELYQNASLLELGVSEPFKIHVERLP